MKKIILLLILLLIDVENLFGQDFLNDNQNPSNIEVIYDGGIFSHNNQNFIAIEINLNKGKTSINFREKMSNEAFAETAYYDSVISNYFIKKSNNQT